MWEHFESTCVKSEVLVHRGERGFGLKLVGNCIVSLDEHCRAKRDGSLQAAAALIATTARRYASHAHRCTDKTLKTRTMPPTSCASGGARVLVGANGWLGRRPAGCLIWKMRCSYSLRGHSHRNACYALLAHALAMRGARILISELPSGRVVPFRLVATGARRAHF